MRVLCIGGRAGFGFRRQLSSSLFDIFESRNSNLSKTVNSEPKKSRETLSDLNKLNSWITFMSKEFRLHLSKFYKNLFQIRVQDSRFSTFVALKLTSLDMEGQTFPPIFKIVLKIYFTSIPSDQVLGTENPRSLGIQAIFAIFLILIFFSKSRFFPFFCPKNFIFYDKIRNTSCLPSYKLLWSSG